MNVENFSLNIELFYLINHTRHPLLDEFFRYFYVFGKGYILIPIVLYLAFLKREKLKPFILAHLIISHPSSGLMSHRSTKFLFILFILT